MYVFECTLSRNELLYELIVPPRITATQSCTLNSCVHIANKNPVPIGSGV